MPFVKPSKKTTEKLRGWLILNPNKPRKKLDERSAPIPKGACVVGHEDGPFESYYENGQLKAKSTYMAGELGGPYELYHENGQLRLRGTYDMGVKCGEWIEDGETVTYDPCPPGLEDGN